MYTYYSSPWQQLKAFLRRKETLPRLILINTGIWVIISLLRVITLLSGSSSPDILTFVLEWLGAPANPMLIPERFWALITYNCTFRFHTSAL